MTITAAAPTLVAVPPPLIRVATTAGSVSIVIPAYNEERTIGACLDAALQQTVRPLEIIVVDNLSTDDTAGEVAKAMLRHPSAPIRYLKQDRLQGITPTRNAGFDSATGDIIGRIDADTRIDRDWVRRTSAALTGSRHSAITGPVWFYDIHGGRAALCVDDWTRRMFRALGPDYRFLFGSNMAITASAWRSVRSSTCADAEDRMHEDLDLAVHLSHAGLTVGYVPHMRAAISARRIGTAPEAFSDYLGRFERTYSAHGVQRWYLNAPPLLLRLVSRPLRAIHAATRVEARVSA